MKICRSSPRYGEGGSCSTNRNEMYRLMTVPVLKFARKMRSLTRIPAFPGSQSALRHALLRGRQVQSK